MYKHALILLTWISCWIVVLTLTGLLLWHFFRTLLALFR
jgi:hypothetical protein